MILAGLILLALGQLLLWVCVADQATRLQDVRKTLDAAVEIQCAQGAVLEALLAEYTALQAMQSQRSCCETVH